MAAILAYSTTMPAVEHLFSINLFYVQTRNYIYTFYYNRLKNYYNKLIYVCDSIFKFNP